jgi:hypothetical protein
MSERKCTHCHRACSGHVGPTGPHCGLTPLEEALSLKDDLGFEKTGAGGGKVERPPLSTDQRLDELTVKFDQLMSMVGGLADRVDKSEKKESTDKSAASEVQENPIQALQQGVGDKLLLPPGICIACVIKYCFRHPLSNSLIQVRIKPLYCG